MLYINLTTNGENRKREKVAEVEIPIDCEYFRVGYCNKVHTIDAVVTNYHPMTV